MTNNTNIDTFSSIEKDIIYFKYKRNIILLGDLNARTGQLQDFINNDNNKNKIVPLPESLYQIMYQTETVEIKW